MRLTGALKNQTGARIIVMQLSWFSAVQLAGLGRLRSVGAPGGRSACQPGAGLFYPTSDALRLRSGSLGFEAEVDGDRNVRGNGLAAQRCWLVLVLLQGFHRGLA